jgi:GNAT superfamily N-acetyltransferase
VSVRYHREMMETDAAPTFRDAEPADADWIAGLLSDEGYPAGGSDIVRRLERFAEIGSPVRVAEHEGDRLGFVAVHLVPRFEHDDLLARVIALVVDPSVRSRGIGRALLAEVDRIAADAGAAFVEVTAGHHRQDARRLFEAAGFDASLTTYLRKRR